MTFITRPSVDESIRCPGQLYYNPTSLLSEAGYGSLIGLTDGGVFIQVEREIGYITAEETGSTITDAILLGVNNWMISRLRSYNATVLALLHPGMTSGTTGLDIDSPGTLKMGVSCFTTGKILFVPNDTVNYPCAYWKNIETHKVPGAKIEYDHTDDAIFPMVCLGKIYQQKKIGSITL